MESELSEINDIKERLSKLEGKNDDDLLDILK